MIAKLKILLGLSIALLLSACAGGTTVESDLGLDHAPDWVNEGSQALNNEDGRLFHGVGQAPAVGDASLQLSVADSRARAEIAHVLSSYVDQAASDYVTSTTGAKDREILQSVSRQIDNSTKLNLSGTRIIARWKDSDSGIVYSLAELDMKQLKGTLAAARDMNEDLRRYMDAQAENIFDRIVRETK